jgi:two-component system nitrogen regulation response regulator GlnG
MLQARGSVLLPAFLPDLSSGAAESAAQTSVNLDLEAFVRQRLQPDARNLYADAHGQFDRFLLASVLEYTGGSQHQAARLLGIARQTLRLKLRDLGLRVTQSIEADEDSES